MVDIIIIIIMVLVRATPCKTMTNTRRDHFEKYEVRKKLQFVAGAIF